MCIRDSQGNVWMALFRGDARVGKYDPVDGKFTEFKALTQPGRIRRASVDLQDRVWYGVYDKGVIGWIDAKSGKVTEAKVPVDISRPYDPQGDYEGNVWFGDDGQGGTTVLQPADEGILVLSDAADDRSAEARD